MTKKDFDTLVGITNKINTYQIGDEVPVGMKLTKLHNFLFVINDDIIKFLSIKLKEGLDYGQDKRFGTRAKSAGTILPKDSTGTV